MSDPIDERIARFESHMDRHIIRIAEILATHFAAASDPLSDSGFFILCGVSSYFEAINQYLAGEDSESKSKVFFRAGFRAVLPSPARTDAELDEIYKWLRCGMYHSAMPMGTTYLHRHYPDPIYKDPGLMVINPIHLVRAIRQHFTQYMADLKDPTNTALRDSFNRRAEAIERSITVPIALPPVSTSSTSTFTTGSAPPFMSGS